jgi:outer membrane protein
MLWLTIGLEGQPKVAYVHSEYLFENYLGTIESYKMLEVKAKKWGDNLDTLSTSYRATFTKYEAGKETLEPKEKQQLEKRLQQKQQLFAKYQKSVEQMKSEEDKKMTQSIIKQMDAYLRDYAINEGYDLILAAGTTSSLVYSEKEYDITDEVLNYINKKYSGGK